MPVDLLVVKASRLCSCVRDSSNIIALAAVKALLLDGDDAMVIVIELLLCCDGAALSHMVGFSDERMTSDEAETWREKDCYFHLAGVLYSIYSNMCDSWYCNPGALSVVVGHLGLFIFMRLDDVTYLVYEQAGRRTEDE